MSNVLAIATEVCNGTSCETVDVDGGAIAGIIAGLGGLIVLIVLLALLALGFWLWMLIDSTTTNEDIYKKIDKGEKTLWVVLMIGSLFINFSFVMALIYYFVIYRTKKGFNKR